MADWIHSLVQARYLVAALGESASPPWWRSEATTPAGRRMLERLYPRTALAASLDVAGRAARLVHDSRTGRLGAYHLFRLPIADEAAIREYVSSPEAAVLLEKLASIQDGAARLDLLARLATGYESDAQGPTFCGTVAELRTGDSLNRVCAAYFHAFSSGQPSYPYLGGAD